MALILLSIHILSVQDYRYDALQKAVMAKNVLTANKHNATGHILQSAKNISFSTTVDGDDEKV